MIEILKRVEEEYQEEDVAEDQEALSMEERLAGLNLGNH